MDRGAWWATVHGVTKSQTGTEWLTLSLSRKYLTWILSPFFLILSKKGNGKKKKQTTFFQALDDKKVYELSTTITGASYSIFIAYNNKTIATTKYVCMLSCSVVSDSWQPMDCSLPGSSVHVISQARIWSGLSFPPSGDRLNLEIEPPSPATPILQVDSSATEPSGRTPYKPGIQ